MAIQILHATQAVGANANNGEIHKEEWNESHDMTGTAGSSLQFSPGGVIEEVVHSFAQLSRSTNLVPGTANTETLVSFDTQDELENMGHSGGTITIQTAGVYQLLFGGQIGKASGSAERTVDMWLKKNDVDIANSSVRNTLANTQTDVTLLNVTTRLAVNDTIKCYIAVDSTTNSPGLYAFTPAVGPAVPAIITSIVKIR